MFVETGAQEKEGREGVGGELSAAPSEWIEREIGELAAHIAAATCRWLELICEFDRRKGHEALGFHSCGAWVSWRCGMDPRSAREHVRVARALEELPSVREEFSRGRLSYSKVRAITRIATPQIEAELVEMARYATAAQLDRLVRGYRRAVSLESAEAAHRDRFLACEWEEDGGLRIRGRLAPEDGALFCKAIEASREAIREREEAHEVAFQGGSAEPRPPLRVNDADALMEVAERSLAGGSEPRPAGERHQVVIHAESQALAGAVEEAGCQIEEGPAICAESARRLACDASLVSVGRKSRVVPAAMRRALDVRDEGRCRFPGCENRRWVDAHHIVHWARGGETKLDNLVLLCSRHHRLVHEGGFGVARSAEGELAFRRPDGKVIPAVPSPAPGSARELRRRNRTARLPIDPGSLFSLGRGERCDRELAVAGLLARAGP
jgi:5-methylcytosine-specific restriction endonuclease McrA